MASVSLRRPKQFKTMEVQAELKTIIFDRAVVDLTPQLLEIRTGIRMSC